MEQPTSNLFEGYRSVGNVTGPLPLIVRHGKSPTDTRILTIVGRTIHTYTSNLTLIEVSLPHEHNINAIISDDRRVFSASGRSIFVWGRGNKHLLLRLDNGHQADVKYISKLGAENLVSIDCDNVLFYWTLKDKEILNIISFDESWFKISALCQPLNYKDKLLIGSEQGQLELWNIPNETCLYKFAGWQDAGVTCITQSPIEDVLGIGLSDGHIYIHNIRYDEIVMKIYQEYGPITSMSFRLDNQPYLVTASEVGHLMVWNLERKRLASQMRNAHHGSISNCQFIRNEALLVTSGNDNAVKIWAMDQSDGSGLMLHHRSGHNKPPSCIQFYGPAGFNLLSAGNDAALKMFHLYSERLNRNLGIARSKHSKNKLKASDDKSKLAPIVCFASETTREKQWDNIVACHRDASYVTTWNYDKCKLGEHFITQPTFPKHGVSATCVTLSTCGNFLFIGFSNGFIFKYNIQSGIFRNAYECPELDEHRGHEGFVSGLVADILNLHLISSGGEDRKLRIWNLKTGALMSTVNGSAPICKLVLHKESSLLAIVLENNEIVIMDLETKELVRRLEANAKVQDACFSPDSRWLIVAHDDKTVRTWDLNLGKLIDLFRLTSVCTSISMSSTGEFLATAHPDSLGINIWCNYTLYCPTILRSIDMKSIDKAPLLDMPFVRCDEITLDDQEAEDQTRPQVADETPAEPCYMSPEQLDANLITLSGLASSRWKNLLNIDDVRRSQLIEEEEKARQKKQIKVPFFIPIKDGLKPRLDEEAVAALNATSGGDDTESSAAAALLGASKIAKLSLLSPLARCLVECAAANHFEPFFSQVKQLGPSATDAELRSLGSDTCGSNQLMLCFLDAIEWALCRNNDYELHSAWLAVFLKAHSDLIQADDEVKQRCRQLLEPTQSSWHRLSEEFNQILSVLNFIRSSIL